MSNHLYVHIYSPILPNTQPTYGMQIRATTPQDLQCTGEEGSSKGEETVNSYLETNNTNVNRPFDSQKHSGFGSNISRATAQVIIVKSN